MCSLGHLKWPNVNNLMLLWVLSVRSSVGRTEWAVLSLEWFPLSGTGLRGQTWQGLVDNEWAGVWIEGEQPWLFPALAAALTHKTSHWENYFFPGFEMSPRVLQPSLIGFGGRYTPLLESLLLLNIRAVLGLLPPCLFIIDDPTLFSGTSIFDVLLKTLGSSQIKKERM